MSELPAFCKQKKLDDLFKEVSERNHADKNILASTQYRSVIRMIIIQGYYTKKESLSTYKLVKKVILL